MLTNTATFVRYNIVGDMPAKEDFWQFVTQRVEQFKFKDIDDTYDEASIGWVSILDMLDTEFEYFSFSAGNNVVLSLRFDQRKVAPKVLKKHCAQEERRIMTERQIPRLSKAHKLEIKENIHLKLMKKAVPVPETWDMVWDVEKQEVLFFSTSTRAQEAFEEFFKGSFDLSLELKVPYTVAEPFLSADDREALAGLAPALIA